MFFSELIKRKAFLLNRLTTSHVNYSQKLRLQSLKIQSIKIQQKHLAHLDHKLV